MATKTHLPLHQQVNIAHIGLVIRQLVASTLQQFSIEKVPNAPSEMLFGEFAAISTFQNLRHIHVKLSEVIADASRYRLPS